EYARFLKSDETETSYKEVALLYEAMLKKELPMTHDFYLKYYQLASGGKELHIYDYVLFDEAQDSNAVMLSIFLNNVCKKILVGDTFQNIYGFNQTINALETINANFHLNLSTNYRSTQEILDYADSFLETCSSKNRVKMHSALKEEVKIKTQAFITRTNAGLIELINTLLKEKANLDEIALLKEPESIFKLLFDIFSFRANRFELISKENAFLHNFDSMFELRAYANYDAELNLALNLSEKDYDFKALQKLALKLYKNTNANLFLINAHLSKGLEWDRVILHNDFISLKDLKTKILEEKNQEEKAKREFELEQELNLFYVAITRARFELEDRSKNNNRVKNFKQISYNKL
ncbi:ATP-dependent helicase, partial [Campylobacter upsaliensis]|nr:ATP-dependent helicase [Campylobacter upsaliensis]